ncbi:MAG TPA: RNA-binding protein [Chloroflexi bacterium]|nr:RNA-binding protein [Chloroflexota bacterium]
MNNRLYVGNLPYSTNEDELRAAFEEYGTVTSVSIITERDTGRSKGFGFVEMSTEEEATEAMNAMNGVQFGGRTLRVDRARPRGERRPQHRDYNDW